MANEAYGIHMTPDLLGGTVQAMDIEKLSKEKLMEMIDATTAVLNRAAGLIAGQLSLPTLSRGDLIGQHNQVPDWPEATETTRGERVKTAGVTGVGFPVYKYEQRTGWTRDYLAKATNQEIMATVEMIYNAHTSANLKRALRALVDDTAAYREWSDDLFKEDGVLRVFPLVRGSGDYTPPPFQSNSFDGTHTHYTCLGATFDEADLTTMADEIREHGFAIEPPGGYGGEILVWINAAERATVEAFTGHMSLADPNVLRGALFDIAREPGDVGIDTYLGYNTAARCWIRVVPFIPAGYQLAFATTTMQDGRLNAFAPLRRRIPALGALQGIRRIQESQYPLVDSFFEDWFGYGVGNRLSATINFVDVGGRYVTPTIP